MEEIGIAIGEIIGTLDIIKDTVMNIVDGVKNIFVDGGTEVIGFADAVSEPVNISKNFLGVIFPGDFVVMIGIGLTIVIALATRRSTNA